MRILPTLAIALALAAPALAQEKTTLQHMVEHGIVVKFPGVDIEHDVAYLPDGKFSAMNGQATGTWRIEGEALCAKGATDPAEVCTRYPAGKKPGDIFDVDAPQGAVTIQINKPASVASNLTTLQYVTTKSVVMKVAGQEYPITYTSDGKLSVSNGMITGAWKIVGEALCSTNSMDPTEVCILYPQGKKPGDEFEVLSPQGPFTIRINK